MILFLSLIYIGLLWLLMKFKVLPKKKWVWLTIIPYEFILFFGFFLPMQWGAPAGDVRTITYSVQIVPNVTGEVTEVLVEANQPLKEGDILFKIDPIPYRAALDGLKAQLELAETRLGQAESLASQQAGSVYEVQSYQAQVDGLKAQITNAEWTLEETVVRAPSDGYVTNLTLRPGARVVNMPFVQAMAFVDTSELILGAQIAQSYSRYVKPGQKAEVTFKALPGKVYPATVEYLVLATAQGQLPLSGFALAPQTQQIGPFFVRLKLDDESVLDGIPTGAMGSSAIYTDKVTMAHVIRKVMIRMDAYMNYFIPN